VYASDLSQDSADKVGRIGIPDKLNTLAFYPIAPVSNSAQPALTQAFIELVLSPKGQELLAKYNLVPVK
jgi:molybdate transport system substrate-binding protein